MHQNMKSLYTRKLYQIAVYQSYFNLNIHLKKQRKKTTPQNQKTNKKSSTLRSHLTADWKGLKSLIKIDEAGTSLAVQWLRLCTSTAGGPGFNSRSRSWDPTSCVVRPKNTNTTDKLMRLWLGVTPSREGKLALSAKMTNTSEAATAGGAHTEDQGPLSDGMRNGFYEQQLRT